MVGYPYRIQSLSLFNATPTTGEAEVRARFNGFADEGRMPSFTVEIVHEEALWCRYELTEILMPKGPLGMAPATERKQFLHERRAVPGLGLNRFEADQTVVDASVIKGSNWLPGTIEEVYQVKGNLLESVVAKDHVAQLAGVHPGRVTLTEDGAFTDHQPYTRYPVHTTVNGVRATTRSAQEASWDLEPIRQYWANLLGKSDWLVEDLVFGLVERFVRRVHLEDPAGMAAIKGRGALYLGNHQTGIESVLFSVVTSAIGGVTTAALAKNEHRETWLGKLIDLWFSYPGITNPELLFFFDRSDPASAPRIIQELGAEIASNRRSVLVHVEGTRSVQCGTPVTQLSSSFIDMAVAAGSPSYPFDSMAVCPPSLKRTGSSFRTRWERKT